MLRSVVAAVLVGLVLVPAAFAASPPAQTSIVGGQPADIDDWPSIAFVLAAWDSDGDDEVDTASQCTGTVIAAQWVLSAAHCAFRPDGDAVDAMLTITGIGDVDDPSGEEIAASELYVHPDWDPQTLSGDALLIRLRRFSSRPPHPVATLGGDYVSPLDVPNAAGWGTTDEESTIGGDVLHEAYLELHDDETCNGFAPDFDAATQTCAYTHDRAGACHGDSGGPLLVFDADTGAPVLWGLTSYGTQLELGMKVCERKAPAIFSWTPALTGWIADTLGVAGPVPPPSSPGGPTPPPTPGGPSIVPPRDHTAPVVRRARLSRARLRAGRRATLSFRLSEPAAVTITVMRKRGRRFRPLSPTMPLSAPAGKVSRRFNGRLRGRALEPGRYKLLVTAVDAAGNAARPVGVPFRMVR